MEIIDNMTSVILQSVQGLITGREIRESKTGTKLARSNNLLFTFRLILTFIYLLVPNAGTDNTITDCHLHNIFHTFEFVWGFMPNQQYFSYLTAIIHKSVSWTIFQEYFTSPLS